MLKVQKYFGESGEGSICGCSGQLRLEIQSNDLMSNLLTAQLQLRVTKVLLQLELETVPVPGPELGPGPKESCRGSEQTFYLPCPGFYKH